MDRPAQGHRCNAYPPALCRPGRAAAVGHPRCRTVARGAIGPDLRQPTDRRSAGIHPALARQGRRQGIDPAQGAAGPAFAGLQRGRFHGQRAACGTDGGRQQHVRRHREAAHQGQPHAVRFAAAVDRGCESRQALCRPRRHHQRTGRAVRPGEQHRAAAQARQAGSPGAGAGRVQCRSRAGSGGAADRHRYAATAATRGDPDLQPSDRDRQPGQPDRRARRPCDLRA